MFFLLNPSLCAFSESDSDLIGTPFSVVCLFVYYFAAGGAHDWKGKSGKLRLLWVLVWTVQYRLPNRRVDCRCWYGPYSTDYGVPVVELTVTRSITTSTAQADQRD